MSDPRFFVHARAFRRWLEKNHDKKTELWVGYYKKGTGEPSLTWPESVDQALCYGWIDGLRRSIDEESYKIRFTPRKPRSNWSAVNIAKMKKLKKAGLVTPAGWAAYDKKSVERSKVYSYERETAELSAAFERKIRANRKAWRFWQDLAPHARKATIQWVMSAKKEETRLRRLGILIESAEAGLRIPPLRR